MKKMITAKSIFLFLILIIGLSACQSEVNSNAFKPIVGFSDETNTQLEKFIIETKSETGRKIAVFDGDGTVLGQTPHYLADEAMYQYAVEHPKKKSRSFPRDD